ncbi:MAG: type II toxin-antitoxin system HicB family antitoxin [Alphaproteobacteria bacterium]|nr:type II toxin-antitoxin system HicB family antitoxin [Alphaproteobacteria bacterium]
MRHYIGLIHKEAESDFGISFPDFPGCVSAGSTLDEALAMGREALEGHIEVMAEAGEPIPEPSDVDTVMQDPEHRDGVVVLVPAPDLSGKAVRVNVTLPEGLLQRIDEAAPNRSRFLAEAAEKLLERKRA